MSVHAAWRRLPTGRSHKLPIDAYVHQPTPLRRQSVPVAELAALFGDLPPMNAAEFRAEQDRLADGDAYFDAYSRAGDPGEGV